MTIVSVDLRRAAESGDVQVAPFAQIEFRPQQRRAEAGYAVTEAAFDLDLFDGVAELTLPALSAWRVREKVLGGADVTLVIPALDRVNYEELQPVDPDTLEPTAEPIAAWWAAIERVVTDDDPRLSDAREALPHGHAVDEISDAVATTDARLSDAREALPHGHLVSEISGAVATTDPRLSDARTPTAHVHVAAHVTDLPAVIDARIQSIVGAAPAALDTLDELAAALGDDANFAGTVTNRLTDIDAQVDAINAELAAAEPYMADGNSLVRRDEWGQFSAPKMFVYDALTQGDQQVPNVSQVQTLIGAAIAPIEQQLSTVRYHALVGG